MSNVVVLNFLYKPKPYGDSLAIRAENWINFFIEHEMYVIGTAPIERVRDLKRIDVKDKGRFSLLPVMSFDAADRWRVGLYEAINRFKDAQHYFLWSADFVSPGEDKSGKSRQIASDMVNWEGDEDLVVGTVNSTGIKESIDLCGTYPLLQVWFPREFELMMQKGILRPRSELLRFSPRFLEASAEALVPN